MEKTIIYLVSFILSSMYIIVPIIGKKINSIEISTFIMSLGYMGYTLSNSNEIKDKKITREEYLNRSLKLQVTMGALNIIYLGICFILDINWILMVIIMLILNTVFGFAFWSNIRSYMLK